MYPMPEVEALTPRDRFLSALNLEEPDRVPMFELEFQYPEKITGRSNIVGDEARRLVAEGKELEVTSHNLENQITLCRGLGYDALQLGLQQVQLVRELAPELALIGGCPAVTPMPGGMDAIDTIRRFYFDKDGLRRECEERTRTAIEACRPWVEQEVEVIRGGMDDMAGKEGPYLNPRLYHEMVFPYLKTLVDAVHNMGGRLFVHSDGDLKPILDGLINTGIDALHSIDPSAGMNIGAVKDTYGHRLCLCGNVDCAWTLVRLRPENVVEETKECIRKASPGGGHILCSSNVIHKAVPLENTLAMVETAKKYGRYPIAGRGV